MNKAWLWLALGLLLLLLMAGVRLLRRKRQQPPVRRSGASARPRPVAAPAATRPPAEAALATAEVQRLAAIEALRQARRRKAQAEALAESRPAEPVSQPALPQVPSKPAAAAAAATPVPLTAPALTPPTVLLVDDSKLVRVKTGRLLQQQGWQVLLAEDGLAALSLLEQAAIDLLITDVEMPGLDGFELTRRVRTAARWRALPVIMITASDDKHRAAACDAGVDLVLGKPYEDETLLAQAQRLLGRAVAPAGTGLALH